MNVGNREGKPIQMNIKSLLKPTPRRIALAIVLVVYLVSFWLPVFDNRSASHNHMSIKPRDLVMGIDALLLSFLFFVFPAWIASPLFWAAMVLFAFRKDILAAVFASIAVVAGISYLLLLRDASIVHEQRYLYGYYVWLCDMAAMAGIAIVSHLVANGKHLKRRRRQLAD